MKHKHVLLFILYLLLFHALMVLPTSLLKIEHRPHRTFLASRSPATVETTAHPANLRYLQGPILAGTVNVYVLFWEPEDAFVSLAYNGLILRYFSDVSDTPFYHNLVQYKDAQGHFSNAETLAASWVDTQPYPAKRLSDAQVQHELAHAMQVRGWVAAPTHLFFVFTAKDVQVCTGKACGFVDFCAYHSSLDKNTPYAVVPYAGTNLKACGVPTSPNGDIDADSAISAASHEQMEATTDPFQNAWVDPAGNEIADKCQWIFGDPIRMHGDTFLLQKEWDNARSTCVLAGP